MKRGRERLHLPAHRAEPPYQPLDEDQRDRLRDERPRAAQVLQALQSGDRGVGMDRGEEQVAGHGRLERQHGGFLIARLAHHDGVGILA